MKITIKGITPQLDGEYELEAQKGLTNRELHLIKQESGVRLLEMEDAIRSLDTDVFVCFAMIALQRAGRGQARDFRDLLWDAPPGAMTFDLDGDEEEDEQPPGDALPPSSLPPSEPSASGGSEKIETASGSATESAGEPSQVTHLRATGTA